MYPEDYLLELEEVLNSKIESLAVDLNESFEETLDTAFSDFPWEDAELSWKIENEEEISSEEMNSIISTSWDYPEVEIENSLKMEVEVTAIAANGESSRATLTVGAIKVDGLWYTLGLL